MSTIRKIMLAIAPRTLLHSRKEEVRLAAFAKIRRPETLKSIVKNEKYHFDIRIAAAEKLNDATLIVYLAKDALSKTVRIEAITRIDDIHTLAEIAKNEEEDTVCVCALQQMFLTTNENRDSRDIFHSTLEECFEKRSAKRVIAEFICRIYSSAHEHTQNALKKYDGMKTGHTDSHTDQYLNRIDHNDLCSPCSSTGFCDYMHSDFEGSHSDSSINEDHFLHL